MVKSNSNKPAKCFSSPLGPPTVVGVGICIAVFWMVSVGPLNFGLLKRFGAGNTASVAALGVFCITIAALVQKWLETRRQYQLIETSKRAFQEVLGHRTDLQEDATDIERAQWFALVWKSQSKPILESWLGQRVTELITRQVTRRTTIHLSDDIRQLAERDTKSLDSSYALFRVFNWCVPLLGLLGTVVAASHALGQWELQTAATNAPLDKANAVLSVCSSFDALGTGLALTVLSLLAQFGMARREQALLQQIDTQVADVFYEALAVDPVKAAARNTPQPIMTMPPPTPNVVTPSVVPTVSMNESIETILRAQTEMLREALANVELPTLSIPPESGEMIAASIRKALDDSMECQKEQLAHQVEALCRIQSEGALQIDARLQQWQTTISEQARTTLRHQQEINKLVESLQQLTDASKIIGAMEAPIQATLSQLTNIDRFHDASICLAEAVAVLGTQMERYGYLGRQPLRRKKTDEQDATKTSDEPLSMSGSLVDRAETESNRPTLRIYRENHRARMEDEESHNQGVPSDTDNNAPNKRIAG